MNSFITGANRFHPKQSIKEMLRFINRRTCLDEDPGGPETSVHVASINVSTQGGGRGPKRGRTVTTIHDINHNLVSGATVNGTFSGTFDDEMVSGTTGDNGQVTLQTNDSLRSDMIDVTFCVDGVTASVPYNLALNDVEPGGSN